MKAAAMSSFISFELSPAEEIEAYKYNDCQIAGIQNLIAAAAEEIVSISINSDQLSLEEQKKLAYTKGQIAILKTLLSRADVIKEAIEAAQDQNGNHQ